MIGFHLLILGHILSGMCIYLVTNIYNCDYNLLLLIHLCQNEYVPLSYLYAIKSSYFFCWKYLSYVVFYSL